MNINPVHERIKARLAQEGDAQLASEVKYIDVNDKSQFVPMPDWFTDVTTLPGVPLKFITEFAGQPNAGKTTAGMIALVNAQKNGFITILVDAERKFSMDRFVRMGGDKSNLQIIQKPSIEESFDALEKSLKVIDEIGHGTPVLVVYDSIAVGVSMAELEKDAKSSATIADQAKVIKRMIRRMLYYIQQCNTAFVVINQLYSQVNGMPGNKFSGGQGLEYGKALSVSFQRFQDLTKTSAGVLHKVGILTKVSSSKNHLLQGDMAVKQVLVEVKSETMLKPAPKKKKANDEPEEQEADLVSDQD